MKRDRGFNAIDLENPQAILQFVDSIRSSLSSDDQFCQQRIVKWHDHISGTTMGIDPDIFAVRRFPYLDASWRRKKSFGWVFRINPTFNHMPPANNVLLFEFKAASRRDPNLLLNEIDPCQYLRDRVLDLNPRIHLKEEKFLRFRIEQEFNRPGPAITDPAGEIQCSLEHGSPNFRSKGRRGSFFDQFLVAPLGGAIPLKQVKHLAMAVAEDLHLDMAPATDVTLRIKCPIAKS